MDSNFQYAEAVKLVVAPFSCAGCLGRVGAPVGVLRFSSFFMSGKPFGTEPGSYDIDCTIPNPDQAEVATGLDRPTAIPGFPLGPNRPGPEIPSYCSRGVRIDRHRIRAEMLFSTRFGPAELRKSGRTRRRT